jgi:hypothetical protein
MILDGQIHLAMAIGIDAFPPVWPYMMDLKETGMDSLEV